MYFVILVSFSLSFLSECLVDVHLISFCPADHVPDWQQPRILLGMCEARSVNVKKTRTTTETGSIDALNERNDVVTKYPPSYFVFRHYSRHVFFVGLFRLVKARTGCVFLLQGNPVRVKGSPYLQHRVATLLVQHGRRHQNHPTRNPFLKSCRFRLCLVQAAV